MNSTIIPKVLFCLIVAHSVRGADDLPPICAYNTYNGEPITPESILRLSPPMPLFLQQSVDDWFKHPEHTDFIAHLARLPNPFNAQTFREKKDDDRTTLNTFEQAKIVSTLSEYNYVLHPQGWAHDFIIKIAGPGPRMQNLLYDMGVDLAAEAKKFPDGIIRLAQCDFDYSKMDPQQRTCLAMGRVAHSLKLKEAKQLHALDRIKHRDVYPYHIPNQPLEIHDGNYVTIEHYICGVKPFKDDGSNEYSLTLKARIDLLTFETLHEVYLSIREAGMWDTQPKNFVIDEEGNVMHLDEEPSGKCPAQQFFYQDVDTEPLNAYALYIDSVARGLGHIHNKISLEPQRAYIRELFAKDVALVAACKRHNVWPEFKNVPN